MLQQTDTGAFGFAPVSVCHRNSIAWGYVMEQTRKKTYISRLENGKADVQLTTLFRIFEGLGRRVSLTIL